MPFLFFFLSLFLSFCLFFFHFCSFLYSFFFLVHFLLLVLIWFLFYFFLFSVFFSTLSPIILFLFLSGWLSFCFYFPDSFIVWVWLFLRSFSPLSFPPYCLSSFVRSSFCWHLLSFTIQSVFRSLLLYLKVLRDLPDAKSNPFIDLYLFIWL